MSTAGAPPVPKGPLGGSFAGRAEAFHDYNSGALHVMPDDIAGIEVAATAARTSCPDRRTMTREHFPLPGLTPKLTALRHRILGELGFDHVHGLPVEPGRLRGGTMIAPDRERIVPLDVETPAS